MSLGGDTMLLQIWRKRLSRNAVKNTGFSIVLEITRPFLLIFFFSFYKLDKDIYMYVYIYIRYIYIY
jgi:hypothetical protein